MPSRRVRSKSAKRATPVSTSKSPVSTPKSSDKKRKASKSPSRSRSAVKPKPTPAKAVAKPAASRSRSRGRARDATKPSPGVPSRSNSRLRKPAPTPAKEIEETPIAASSSRISARPVSRTFESADDAPRAIRSLTQSRERPASSLLNTISPKKPTQQCCANIRDIPSKICRSVCGTATNISRSLKQKNRNARRYLGVWYLESIAVFVVSCILIVIAMQVMRYDPARLRIDVNRLTSNAIKRTSATVSHYYEAISHFLKRK